MIYTILFFGLPVLGVVIYCKLILDMLAARIASPPWFPLLFIFTVYGAILQFAVSQYFRTWSGMHSLAAFGLLVIGAPWSLAQGFFWRSTWPISSYHRTAILSSFAFPVIMAILVAVAFESGR